MIDLGLPARTQLRETLGELRQRGVKLAGALITHEHGDHFSAGAVRAMSGLGVPVFAPRRAIDHACHQLEIGYWSGRPQFICYDEGECWERVFEVGPFEVTPIEVTHHPGGSCFAFRIRVEGRGRELSAVLATDLCEARGLPAALVDADLIYLESNYDPHLLKMKPNPASRFHLENRKCGELLAEARKASSRPPQQVTLGHLSEQRNSPGLAMESLKGVFEGMGMEVDFPFVTAPRYWPGRVVEVMG